MTYRKGTTGFNQGMCRPQQQRNRHTFPYSCTPKRTGTKFIFQEPSQRKPRCLYFAGLSSTTTLHHKHLDKQGKHSLPSVSPIISRTAWGVVRLIQDCSPLAWLVQIRVPSSFNLLSLTLSSVSAMESCPVGLLNITFISLFLLRKSSQDRDVWKSVFT